MFYSHFKVITAEVLLERYHSYVGTEKPAVELAVWYIHHVTALTTYAGQDTCHSATGLC